MDQIWRPREQGERKHLLAQPSTYRSPDPARPAAATPSATIRRIKAQSSAEITHPICLGGLVFDRRSGLVSSVVDTRRFSPARRMGRLGVARRPTFVCGRSAS